MANYVILGVEGDSSVYLVDLVNKTVSSMDRSLVDIGSADLGSSGIKGIDLAIAASARSDAASLYLSPAT